MQEKQLIGGYIVTDEGKVYSTKYKDKHELSPGKTSRNNKYLMVNLWENGKHKAEYVHRLVAQAFIPNPDNLPEVNHLDGNPGNNQVDNLEWCTQSQNIQHSYRTGLHKKHICKICGGESYSKHQICNHCRKNFLEDLDKSLTSVGRCEDALKVKEEFLNKYPKIFTLREHGATLQQIADIVGCTKQNISYLFKKYRKSESEDLSNENRKIRWVSRKATPHLLHTRWRR